MESFVDGDSGGTIYYVGSIDQKCLWCNLFLKPPWRVGEPMPRLTKARWHLGTVKALNRALNSYYKNHKMVVL